MKYGKLGVTPNAHRSLIQVKKYLRCAWDAFKVAVKWQIRGV